MFLEISQNSPEYTCARAPFLIKLQAFYRTPLDDCFYNKLKSISCGIFLSFKSRHLELLCKIIIQLFSTGIFLGLFMVKKSILQLYKTTIFLAQLRMAASNHLIIKCNQKIRQVKNQVIKHQIRRKIKAIRLVKFLSYFFKWLECVVLGELQVPNALQHRFKIFSGTT